MFAIQSSSTPAPSSGSWAESWLEGERIRSAERGNIRSFQAQMASIAEDARQFNIQEARLREQGSSNSRAAINNNRLANLADFNTQAREAAKAGENEVEGEKVFGSLEAIIKQALDAYSEESGLNQQQPTTQNVQQQSQQPTTQVQNVDLTGNASQMNLTANQPQTGVQQLKTEEEKKREEEDWLNYRTAPLSGSFDWGKYT